MSKTILVCDDALTDRTNARKILESHGYRVIEAENGDAGYQMALDHGPDLILMDVVMPVSGFAATRMIKKNPKIAAIPIVMLTSVKRETDRENALDNGASGYLVKPARNETLMQVIDKVFAGHKAFL